MNYNEEHALGQDNVYPVEEQDVILTPAEETVAEAPAEEKKSPFDAYVANEKAARQAAAAQVTAAQAGMYSPMIINGGVFKPLPAVKPVIAPASHVQLTPIVVPVAMVPFASQNQPVLQYKDEPEPVQQTVEQAPAQEEVYAAPAEEPVYYEEPADQIYYDESYTNDGVAAADGNYEVSSYEAAGGKKVKKGSRVRSLIMFFAGLFYLVPFIMCYLNANTDIISNLGIDYITNLSKGILKEDIIGSFIGAISDGDVTSFFSIDNLGNLFLFASIIVTLLSMIVFLIGIIVRFKISYWVFGFALVLLNVAFVAYEMINLMIVDGGFKFELSGIVGGLMNNLPVIIHLLVPAIIILILGCILRIRKDKGKKQKKSKKSKAGKTAPALA